MIIKVSNWLSHYISFYLSICSCYWIFNHTWEWIAFLRAFIGAHLLVDTAGGHPCALAGELRSCGPNMAPLVKPSNLGSQRFH